MGAALAHAHPDATLGDVEVVGGRPVVRNDAGPFALERADQLLLDFLVLVGNDAADQRDLGTEGAIDGRVLDTGRTTTADDDPLGVPVELGRGVIAVEDTHAVEGDTGNGARPRARIDHDRSSAQLLLLTVSTVDDDGAVGRQPSDALDERDTVLAEEEVNALVQLLDDLLAALEGSRVIALNVTDDNAELLCPARLFKQLGALEQRLARDAPAVQAGATDLVLLHDGDLQAELCGADRRDVATGATTEEYDVELLALFDGHSVLLRLATDKDPPPETGGCLWAV
ncbi:hypothetical protein HRbin27_00511 [bacterium HR27]|nr:hypothetical protein HRbin27_00511 [bacterium HR27]